MEARGSWCQVSGRCLKPPRSFIGSFSSCWEKKTPKKQNQVLVIFRTGSTYLLLHCWVQKEGLQFVYHRPLRPSSVCIPLTAFGWEGSKRRLKVRHEAPFLPKKAPKQLTLQGATVASDSIDEPTICGGDGELFKQSSQVENDGKQHQTTSTLQGVSFGGFCT